MTSGNLKIEQLPVTSATSNSEKLFVNKFDLKSSLFEVKSLFVQGFITQT